MIGETWLETWAQWQVIGLYIGLGALGLVIAFVLIYLLVVLISDAYKKHSKKYVWDCIKRKYVRKEKTDSWTK